MYNINYIYKHVLYIHVLLHEYHRIVIRCPSFLFISSDPSSWVPAVALPARRPFWPPEPPCCVAFTGHSSARRQCFVSKAPKRELKSTESSCILLLFIISWVSKASLHGAVFKTWPWVVVLPCKLGEMELLHLAERQGPVLGAVALGRCSPKQSSWSFESRLRARCH